MASGAPEASAPPIDKITVQGYEHANHQPVCAPPPSYDAIMQAPPDRGPPPSAPVVSEEEAREALTSWVSDHCCSCCYGTDVVKDMVFRDLASTSAFHYHLESWGETRTTAYVTVPYRGGYIDGPQNGPAPGPWDIIVPIPSEFFKKDKTTLPVPHTETVMPCHNCHGAGQVRCWSCHGKGNDECFTCNGRGRKPDPFKENEYEDCFACNGRGRKDCISCHGCGMRDCMTCMGAGQIKSYVNLKVKWIPETDDSVIDNSSNVPPELITKVSGQVVLAEQQERVYPIRHFPEAAVNDACQRTIDQYSNKARNMMMRILQQKHKLQVVPVTRATYTYKDQDYDYYVYGYEHKVYHPDYPQSCCYCCTII